MHIGQDVIQIVDAPTECAVSEIDDEFGADDFPFDVRDELIVTTISRPRPMAFPMVSRYLLRVSTASSSVSSVRQPVSSRYASTEWVLVT